MILAHVHVHGHMYHNNIIHICAVGEELCCQLSNAGAKLIMTARNENRLNTIWRSLSVPDNAK